MDLRTRQRYIRAVVQALGGPTRVAYLAGGVSNQTIYNWVDAGLIVFSKPALLVAQAARERHLSVWGIPVTAESLAGLIDPPSPEPEQPAVKATTKTRKRLRLVEPEAAVAAARAKWEANPPKAYGRVTQPKAKGRPNNCPLLVKLAA